MTDKLEELGDRRSAILRAIVSHYVRTGEPVGSKTLVERYRLKVSPATVRNEMAALEEAGLISQPHTSAGRVPTDTGYRLFVDTFGREARLSPRDALRVRDFFGEPRWELEDALRQTAALLSSLTDHAAVVFAPALDRSVIRHVDLVQLSEERAMLVVVTDTGRVENHIITLPSGPADAQLDETSQMLNRMLVDVPLEKSASSLAKNVERFPLELRELAEAVAAALRQGLAERQSRDFFLEGASNIVDEQKFSSLEQVREVISALEHRRLLLEVLADALGSRSVSVRIGSENPFAEMRSCAVVTASYGSSGPIGSLGVVGPTRMDYRRTIAAVHEVSSNLGRMLEELGI